MAAAEPDERPPLDLVVELGETFKRLRMDRHVVLLRAYYRARTKGGTSLWDDAFVVEWFRLLRLRRHDSYYVVQPRNSNCRACGAAGRESYHYTSAVWPGGARMTCAACGAAWLELAPEGAA